MAGLARQGLGTVVLAAIGAVAAVVLSVVVLSASRTIVGISAFAGIAFVMGGVLSGNLRLYCLWGLLVTAPLDLSKRFMPLFHMGGEGAFRVEASDFFLLALLAYLVRDLAVEREWKLRIPRAALWWTLVIGLGVVSVVLGPYRLAAAHESVRMVKALLLFLVVANSIVTERQVRQVVAGLFAVAAAQSVVALLQFFLEMNFGLVALGETEQIASESLTEGSLIGQEITRVGAFMTHPNVFAAYLAFLLPIGIALLFARIPSWFKSLAVVTLLLGELALVATGSRSGWVSFAAAFVVVMATSFVNPTIRKQYLMTRVIIVIGAVVVGAALSGYIVDRLTKSDPGAVDIRWRLAGDAWRMIQASPVLGHGLNSYVYAMPPYTSYSDYAGVSREYGDYLPAVHNIFLLWWSETGTIGLVLHLLVLFAVARAALALTRLRRDFFGAVGIGALGSMTTIVIDGMFSFTLRVNGFLRVFWIVAGLLFAIRYLAVRQEAEADAEAGAT
ncbi:MAG: O-antigen ligase family protein [Planctomycetota bacterium]